MVKILLIIFVIFATINVIGFLTYDDKKRKPAGTLPQQQGMQERTFVVDAQPFARLSIVKARS